MKRIFFASIPLWVVMLVIVGMSVITLLALSFFREEVMNYALMVSPLEDTHVEGLAYGEQPALSNPDFFRRVEEELIAQKASFVEADLSAMTVRVYHDGVSVAEVAILTKGKEGSWWETPSGIYKIASKEKDHFSSFGKVHQPWSMAFQGNFFIHGWPYYPDGTPVASAYSGGCIRLADADAKTVYDLATVGMPVLVYKQAFTPDTFSYRMNTPLSHSSNYIVADLRNNFIFGEKNASSTIPLREFGQFLSSLIATDYINIEKTIVLDDEVIDVAGDARFVAGEATTPYDLLHLELLGSSNAPMRVFADVLGEKRFTVLANDKAEAIGMSATRFALLSIGGTDLGETTPEDLFYLTKYVYNNRKFLFDISAGKRTNTIYDVSRFAGTQNENLFTDDPRFIGGKAIVNEDGTSDFLGVFLIEVGGEERPILVFLKNSPDAKKEASAWLDYVRVSYR